MLGQNTKSFVTDKKFYPQIFGSLPYKRRPNEEILADRSPCGKLGVQP